MEIQFPGHLHVHTEYSPLDGLAKIDELAAKAKALGQTFIAITDHGSSSGLFECAEISKKHGIKILLGEEFYYENPEGLKLGHLILIAKNRQGLRNLFKLQSMAYDNFYYKPRINIEMLKEYGEGLICTTACIANQVGQYILKDEICLALNHIFELKQIFQDDLYIEMQSSTNEDVIKVNKKLEELCKHHNLQSIITNDVHYVNKEDYNIHEVLLCIQQKGKMNSPKRWKFEHNDYWLKSGKEMEQYLDYLDEETIKNSYINLQAISDKCEDELDMEYGNYLPKFCETKEEEDTHLSSMVWDEYLKGKIFKRGEQNDEFKNDLLKELKVISDTGYSGYFLIVQEYIGWARENGILVGDGRGSGAGCKVAYTIGITEVNPQKHDLLFERFLSIGRSPDFDVDFSDINAVFKHLQDVYGTKNVARVGAFSRFTAKSAIRKVMGVFGFSQAQIAQIVSLLPKRLTFTLEEALNESDELSLWFENNKNLLHIVKKLEGIVEHMSTHAGGVIICENLTSILPIIVDSDDREKMIVALDKKQLEAMGHYKFDILGLRSLTLMGDIIQQTGKIDWHEIDFEDENIYKMLCSGDVLGVFQLSDQKDKVMQQQPRCFEDLIAINALIRPGVCDWDEYMNRRFNYPNDEESSPYMQCTHGLIVYQDQYLQLAQEYAGWDIAYSDKHIRKNKDILNDIELKEKWLKDTGGMEDLWNTICGIVSGGYGFNRAHSTSYAMLTYQTAYMKYYFPKEFYAAYMTQNVGDTTKISEAINLLKDKGIKIIPPDINGSTDKFVANQEGITMPLTCIKSVGGSVVYEINRLKPIEGIEDFMSRRIKKFVKSNAIENLIKAGCFDFEGKSRTSLLQEYTKCTEEAPNHVFEKEVFDYYISESPFDNFDVRRFDTYKENDQVITVVMPTEINVRYDKKGGEMAFITAVNNTDTIRMIAFSSIWKKYKCEESQLILVKGKKDKGSLLVSYIEPLNTQ